MRVKTKYTAFVPKNSVGTVVDEDKYSYLIEFENMECFAYAKSQVKKVD